MKAYLVKFVEWLPSRAGGNQLTQSFVVYALTKEDAELKGFNFLKSCGFKVNEQVFIQDIEEVKVNETL